MPHQLSSVSVLSQLRLVQDVPTRNTTTVPKQHLHQLDPLTTTIGEGLPTRAGPILFSLGPVVVTPAAVELFERIERDPRLFLALHATGTWGAVDPHRAALNQASIDDQFGTVRSLYDLGNLFGIAATIEIVTTLAPSTAATTIQAHGVEVDVAFSQ